MTLQRYLDGIEVQLMNPASSFSIDYEGRINSQALAQAFKLLCIHHPVLRGRIRLDNQGYLLYVPQDHQPEFVALEGDKNTFLREVWQPWDNEQALARLVLVEGNTGGHVSLRWAHAIADGSSMTAIFRELWETYSRTVGGSAVEVEQGSLLPLAPYELMKKYFSDIQLPPSADALKRPVHVDTCEILQPLIQLGKDETAKLVATARSWKTSVHALICGAIMIVQRTYCASSRAPANMACRAQVDLRRRVNPPVGATETTNFLANHEANVSVAANSDPVAVGREIKAQLSYAIDHPKLLRGAFLGRGESRLETPLEPRLAKASVGNRGVVPRFASPPGMKIATFNALRNIKPLEDPGYTVHTYEGRLNIRCNYRSDVFTHHDVEGLTTRIKDKIIDLMT